VLQATGSGEVGDALFADSSDALRCFLGPDHPYVIALADAAARRATSSHRRRDVATSLRCESNTHWTLRLWE
jgi:hypothetical protein